MKQACAALTILVVFAGNAVRAAPPTVVPSPGYDARLQEQRATAGTSARQGTAPKSNASRYHRRSRTQR